MKVVRVNSIKTGGSNKTAAFFDIQTNEGIIVKGFKLINGVNGLFAASPNQKGKDGKYYETVTVPKELMEDLQNKAIEEFNKAN